MTDIYYAHAQLPEDSTFNVFQWKSSSLGMHFPVLQNF